MKKILISTLVFFTISCVDEKPAEYEEKLTVFSSITGGLSMGVGGDTCVVSLSNEITNDLDPKSLFISDAMVIISENGSEKIDTLFAVENRPGRYLTKKDVIFDLFCSL